MKRRRSPHRPDCRHCPRVRQLGRDYQAHRAAWLAQREQAGYGYATESAEFDRDNPGPLFRDYLLALAGTGWPMSGRQPAYRLVAA